MLDVIDKGGMICGFSLRDGAPAEIVEWSAEDGCPELDRADDARPLWLHFNFVDTRAEHWIASCEQLPAEAREQLLQCDPRIHVEPLGEGLIGVLGDLHHDFEEDPEGFGVLRFYLGRNLVVSGRHHPLQSSDRLRRELRGGEQVANPIQWLSHLVHHLAETFATAVAGINEHLDATEDRILQQRVAEEGKELGQVRRLLARLRRQVGANRQTLVHARARLPRWCEADDAAQLRLAIERLEAVSQDLELVQERARLLQEEIAARLGEATNRNLYLLSIVTTVMLPINLITGMFGMNFDDVPGLHTGGAFWIATLLMGGVAGITLLVLHWRKLF